MLFSKRAASLLRAKPSLGKVVLYTALLLALALVLFPAMPLKADERSAPASQLSECIVTAENPCADIAEVSPRVASQKPMVKRSMRITKSPTAADQSVQGLLPSAKIGQTTQVSPMASANVTTRLVLRNRTYSHVYWRVGARRSGSVYFWPSASTAYVVNARSSVTKSISCRKNERIGFGAQSTNGYSVWGYGLWAEYYPYCVAWPCDDFCNGKTHYVDLY